MLKREGGRRWGREGKEGGCKGEGKGGGRGEKGGRGYAAEARTRMVE